MRSGYTRFRGMPGVGSYVNNEWQLDKIGQSIEYVCSVKSATINLDRQVDLRCASTSFLSEKIISCTLLVSLEYASHVAGYNPSTRYCLGSLSMRGSLEIYCTGSVSGESRSWQRLCCEIDCIWFNMVNSVNMPNSFVTLGSCVTEIDKKQTIGMKLGSSGAPENTDLISRFRNHNSTRTI